MKTLELKGQTKEVAGSKVAKNLRKEGLVPCVVYGGEQPVHFSAEENDLKKFIFTPNVYLTAIDIDGKKITGIVKDTQFHPVTDDLLHVDFIEVSDNKKVRVQIPVAVTGNSVGVRAGGKLSVNVRKVNVEAFPKDLPDAINVDVTNLNIGDKLRVSEIAVENVSILEAESVVIAAVKVTRSSRSAAAAAAATATPGKK